MFVMKNSRFLLMVEGYEDFPTQIKACIPNFQTFFYNLARDTNEEIKDIAKLRMTMMMFRDISTK